MKVEFVSNGNKLATFCHLTCLPLEEGGIITLDVDDERCSYEVKIIKKGFLKKTMTEDRESYEEITITVFLEELTF